MITVRDATRDDIPALLPQARAFAESAGFQIPIWPGDDEAARFLAGIIEEQVLLVAVNEFGAIVGFIMGSFAPHYFNATLITLTELAWWVEPDQRGSRAGMLLLQAFCAVGQQYARWTTLSLEETSPINDRTLERRGFRRVERTYLREEVA